MPDNTQIYRVDFYIYCIQSAQSPVNIKFGQHDIRKFNLHA